MARSPVFAGALLAVFLVLPAFADTQQISAFQSWGAYVSHGSASGGKGSDVCYVSAKPSNTDSKNHAGVFAEVTHRPAEHHYGVIDILESYTFKPGSPATLTIGKASFTLFTNGVAAFAKDDDDAKIVAAMRAHSAGLTTTDPAPMLFVGTDKKGKQIKDSFSLLGMEQAYKAIGKTCHVPASAVSAKKK